MTSSTRVIGSALAQMRSVTSREDEQFGGVSAREATEGLRQLLKTLKTYPCFGGAAPLLPSALSLLQAMTTTLHTFRSPA